MCQPVLDHGFPQMDKESLSILSREFGAEEVKHALFSMDPNKAPGPDGFHTTFFQ